MSSRLRRAVATTASILWAAAVAVAAARLAPPPSADVSRGSEEAFVSGAHPRELPPRSRPLRWLGPRALVRFEGLPPGARTLEVAARGHRGPLQVAADGVVLGALAVGTTSARFALPAGRPRLTVELRAEPFGVGDGRVLGAQLDRVAVIPAAAPAWPGLALLACFVVPAAVIALAAGWVRGVAPAAAAAAAGLVSVAQALALWPQGILRSPYAATLAVCLAVAGAWCAAFAGWVGRRAPGAGPWALAAALAAVLVQGVAATSPVMVVSDVGLHANKLIGVARGNLFPTSLTQHTPPFVVPYGVSFYVLLLPLYRAGLDPAWLVRGAAALSGIAASLALLRTLAPSGPRRAALAVLLLQLLPGTFLIYSYGNLSNVFAQSLMVAFFCWWVGGAPGGWPLGAALLGTAATAHLSGFIVSAALCGALALARRRDRTGDRTRLWAIAAGLGAGAAYYAAFLPLVWASLARMGEGGGQGGAASRGMAAAFVRQLRTAVELWGIPVLPLALLGRPRPAAGRPLDRDLAAYWAGCGLLLVPAVLSPLDVRYLHALGVPIAIAAAGGVAALAKRGRIATLAAAALLGAQAVLALRTILESVIERYR